MKILVTGASGMVGRNLLADPRAALHQIAHPARGELDLTDGPATIRYVGEFEPELIVHLAGLVGGIQANIDRPARFLSENLAVGLNVVGAARAIGAPGLINLGSSCMYPRDLDRPLCENLLLSGPLEATNEAYALAKIAVAKLIAAHRREIPMLKWVTLIAPNLYGRFDHFDLVRSHLLAAAIMKVDAAMRSGENRVEIWGDGSARREFMFAADLADFIWSAAGRLDELPAMINVGVGADHTVREYYGAVAVAAGYEGAFVTNLAKPSGMRRKLLDVSAQAAFGWAPATPLQDGVAAALAYYRSLG
ncbi:MAG TPA: NAD-dependent epimerase/dehydratase family protein [Caulobacteraceae bacterium]